VVAVLDGGARIAFALNGRDVAVEAGGSARLSDVLRGELGRGDVKIGCDAGDCGACTVLLDGAPVCACLTSLSRAEGRRVETLAGLVADEPRVKALRDAFLATGGAQCGICTPGMLVSAVALLRADPAPSVRAVEDALGGVLCRCTGYRAIVDAVRLAGGASDVAVEARSSDTTASATAGATAGAVADAMPSHATVAVSGTTSAAATGVATSVATRVAIGAAANPVADARTGEVSTEPRHTSVGQPLVRLDGARKVDGTERFGDDLAPSDALVLRLIRSPHHHAAFAFGDVAAWRDARPGVTLVLDAGDVPGINRFGVIPPFVDQPVFAERVARFRGEAVAAVVGDAAALAALDLASFPVSWEPREPALTPAAAGESGAALLHEGHPDNVLCRGNVRHGDVDDALARSAITVEGEFSTGFVEHAYIEPEAGFARRVRDDAGEDRIELHGCTQAPYMDRDAVAAILGMAPEAIRIVPSATGGGFGSKLDLSWQPFVALAALRTGRAVRVTYTRRESMQSTTKRHPSTIRATLGCDDAGRLTGMRFDGTFNTGAYASWGPTVANRVPVHASGPYRVPHYAARATGVYTHCAPAGAFRGFGVPQAAIAQEALMDELAERAGVDRLRIRLDNALSDGVPTVTGQVFASGVGIRACLERLVEPWERALADAARANAAVETSGSPWRRGVGIASGWYGCGNTSLPNPSTIRAGVRADGSVCLHQGAVDLGQGANTVIAQLFADALGVPVGAVELVDADTDRTPDAGKTSASRQTFVSGNAAVAAARALAGEIRRATNLPPDALGGADALARLPVDADGYVLAANGTYDPPTEALDHDGQGVPYAQFGYAAQLVVADVDIRLGRVELVHVVAAHDVGRAINPVLVEGQVHGGVAQGIGLALMEEFVPGRTENLHDYLIPTFGDVPPIDTLIVEVPDPHGPMGAKGLGEHALIPTAPAVLAAIRHASGARIRELPATPERVLAAIRAAEADAGTDSESGSDGDGGARDRIDGAVRAGTIAATGGEG